MVKRKAKELENGEGGELRRSSRRISSGKGAGDGDIGARVEKQSTVGGKGKKDKDMGKVAVETDGVEKGDVEVKNPIKIKPSTKSTTKNVTKNTTKSTTKPTTTSTPPAPEGRQYWLMKAEPESRFEKGIDIKFSIDDLAAKTEPEPWDGIRAYPARNNLRAMRPNDLAFFYHSSCKVPAIVGTMSIVRPHTPDLTAHDPNAPYYDASSTPENPKWSVVHVEFRQKLKTPVTLKWMKEYAGDELKELQMLRLGRLSVSRVSGEEWAFLRGVMAENGDLLDE